MQVDGADLKKLRAGGRECKASVIGLERLSVTPLPLERLTLPVPCLDVFALGQFQTRVCIL
jgi:hypothetical protein